jgi:hypothetical protein
MHVGGRRPDTSPSNGFRQADRRPGVWFKPGKMPDMFDELDLTRSLHPPMSETRR